MSESTKSQIIRQKFIDATFSTRGTAIRADVQDMFGVSAPTATRDFTRYLDDGGNAQFIYQRGQYERDYHFKSLYFKSAEEATRFLDSLRHVYGMHTI